MRLKHAKASFIHIIIEKTEDRLNVDVIDKRNRGLMWIVYPTVIIQMTDSGSLISGRK